MFIISLLFYIIYFVISYYYFLIIFLLHLLFCINTILLFNKQFNLINNFIVYCLIKLNNVKRIK